MLQLSPWNTSYGRIGQPFLSSSISQRQRRIFDQPCSYLSFSSSAIFERPCPAIWELPLRVWSNLYNFLLQEEACALSWYPVRPSLVLLCIQSVRQARVSIEHSHSLCVHGTRVSLVHRFLLQVVLFFWLLRPLDNFYSVLNKVRKFKDIGKIQTDIWGNFIIQSRFEILIIMTYWKTRIKFDIWRELMSSEEQKAIRTCINMIEMHLVGKC